MRGVLVETDRNKKPIINFFSMLSPAQYYVRFSGISHEEDVTHEFKGHRNICKEEIPAWALVKEAGKPSRKPISRNLCGFLNTGLGGTVYCGVGDDGTVHGLTLTQYQRDHIITSVQDIMTRFNPPVPSNRYKVRFVPVFGPTISEQERKRLLAFNTRHSADPELRKRKHTLRGSKYCWCDRDSVARYKNGTLITEYVIELIVLPWDPDNKELEGIGSIFNLHPIHADEMGVLYFRQQASLCQYTLQEITRMTYFEVDNRKRIVIARLKQRIAELESSNGKETSNNDCVKIPIQSKAKKSQLCDIRNSLLQSSLLEKTTPADCDKPLLSHKVTNSMLFSLPSVKMTTSKHRTESRVPSTVKNSSLLALPGKTSLNLSQTTQSCKVRKSLLFSLCGTDK